MKPVHRTLLAAAFALPASLGFSVAHALTWDAAADFPDVSHANPNGVWTYGYDTVPGPGYQLKPFDAYNDNVNGVPFFTDSTYHTSTTPNFKKNMNNAVPHAVPFGLVSLHPGPVSREDDAILRFTAPRTTDYDVNAKFFVGDTGETEAWVILNGNRASPLASLGITSLEPSFTLSAYRLKAGDTLDFVVGSDDAYFSDDTPLAVTISTVPEPGTYALLLCGIGAIGLHARRSTARRG